MIAHHIHNAHFWNCHLEEIGTQVDCSTYEQTAVAAADNGYILRRGPAFLDEIFSRTDEVVEYVHLVHLCAGKVPFLTIFRTST